MKKNKRTSDLELAVIAIAENIYRWLGKSFSYVLPVMVFLMSIGIGRGIFIVADWPTRTFLFIITLFCFFGGIFLLIKRKSLWKDDDI